MLTRYRTAWLRNVLSLGAAAALAICNTGCGSVISGEHDTGFHYLVSPHADGTYYGWTEITLDGDINSVGTANLWAVTLSVESPPEADLTFMSNVLGQSVVGTTLTPVATLDQITRGEQAASMDIVYLGDLHPLFESSSTIRLQWTGTANPAFTAWPAGGIWVHGDVTINVQ